MSRVTTFSRYFPAYHSRAGEPTNFVLQTLRSLLHWSAPLPDNISECVPGLETEDVAFWMSGNYPAKHHTIRAGKSAKVGDVFSPRIWSGRPYASKQIQFAPDITLYRVFDFELVLTDDAPLVVIDGEVYCQALTHSPRMKALAANDGLSAADMLEWFGIHPKRKAKGFSGQIRCWNESVEYTPLFSLD